MGSLEVIGQPIPATCSSDYYGSYTSSKVAVNQGRSLELDTYPYNLRYKEFEPSMAKTPCIYLRSLSVNQRVVKNCNSMRPRFFLYTKEAMHVDNFR